MDEVRSFLGMTNFTSRFIPNYSTVSGPLRELTCKGSSFRWGPSQQHAFDQLKKCLMKHPILKYYDKNKKTELFVDASPIGLAAILTQKDSSGTSHVIAYGSRSLTSTEQRYAQIEREALAIVWACEHFHLYIFGGSVTVVTDHKPLVSMLNSPSANLPMRIERWSLRLQPYQPKIVYKQGRDNPADYLSRHPNETTTRNSRQEIIAEEYINFIASSTVPKAMTQKEIEDSTQQDATLQKVKELISTNSWYTIEKSTDSILKSYYQVRNELSCTLSGLVLRGRRVCLPLSLQQKALDIAHEGHQGLTKTKQLLREKVWFPGIDKSAEDTVSSCLACQASDVTKQPRQPLVMTPLPEHPWTELCADFYGPLPSGHHLLVIIDEYSRFPEVEIIKSTAAKVVIPLLDKLFASRGIPQVLKTDNGPPFQSEEFREFAEELGFRHRKITPYWPEANACAERFMKNLGKLCRCAQLSGKPWQRELYRFLRNYRTTPHSSTGIPPATIVHGYQMATKLPVSTREASDIDKVVRRNDEMAKQKMKENAEKRRKVTYQDNYFQVGEEVLVKNTKVTNKTSPNYMENPYQVQEEKGSMVIVRQGEEVKARNKSHLKKVRIKSNHLPKEDNLKETPKEKPKRNRVSPRHLTDYMTY